MILGTVFKRVVDEAKNEAERKAKNAYWVTCPECGRQVVKKELASKGCYICGYQENGNVSDRGRPRKPYQTHCPECGVKVITQQLHEEGCYICGWRRTGGSA